jgi:hypothetical protein
MVFRLLISDFQFLISEGPRSSARIEQQPSKLWVTGSNPVGVAKNTK